MNVRRILLTVITLLVLVPAARPAARADFGIDPRISALLEQVSPEHLERIDRTLVGFGTRYLMSSQTDEKQGVGAAWKWIYAELSKYPRLKVSYDTYQLPAGTRVARPVELRNVMAVLPGASERRVYVSGHYDSIAGGGGGGSDDRPAPGANDDGSGTSITMELARVFAQSDVQFDATIVFLCLSGEEEGLYGSKAHADKAKADGTVIDAVLNNDITGNSHGGDKTIDGSSLRIFALGPEDSPSRQLARYIQRVAALYVPGHAVHLIARQDRFGRGGDHESFNDAGYAAVRISESKENYAMQHSANDTPDGVDFIYLAKNARVNAAAAASLALAPPAPFVGRTPSSASQTTAAANAGRAGGANAGAAGAGAAGAGRAGGAAGAGAAGAGGGAGAGRAAGAASGATAGTGAAGAGAGAGAASGAAAGGRAAGAGAAGAGAGAGAGGGRGRGGAPGLSRGAGYDAQLRWAAAPGAVGYRIFWRDGWSPNWQHELTVGNVTEYTFANMSIDDFMFGVAAIGKDGHESLVAAYQSR